MMSRIVQLAEEEAEKVAFAILTSTHVEAFAEKIAVKVADKLLQELSARLGADG
jgi:GGDEF domain-containing protein